MGPVVRISIFTVQSAVLTGIKQLSGLMHFFAGVDKERSQITNVNVWDSVENAKQLSTFQPMLDLGKEFSAKGATLLSLIQSAKLNGHDPYVYLKDVLARLPTQKSRDID